MTLPNTGFVTNGDVIHDPTGTYSILGTTSFSNYVQSGPHDWTNNDATVEIVQAPTTANYETTFQARNPANSADEVSIQIRNGYIRFRQDNAQLAQLAYTPGDPLWFKLASENADVVYFTSADGETWTERHRAVANFPITASILRIFAYCATENTERSIVRNINGAPDIESPTAPIGLSASVTGDTATLYWTNGTDNVGIDHHEVHRSTTIDFTPSLSTRMSNNVAGTATTYVDANMANGTYYYKVVSVDGFSNASPASNQAIATVAVVPPSGYYRATDGAAIELLRFDGSSWK